MRTKHLFYTAAMAALFAACVNDDFETIGQQGNVANDGRPVVGNVKLNFTQDGEADTRLSYGGQGVGYQWEATDEIGALLMDNVKAHEGTWLEKYSLISDIHTSFRFTYDTEDKVWGCDTKMLEGNYFFAYPWEDYDGRREVAHSLMNQTQEGIAPEVRAESYANNQFFIGYSRIMAGTKDTETLNDVKMVSLLGAIELRIKNTGTVAKHINKVVLSGNENISSVMTFDPTNAPYGTEADADKWNLQETGYTNWFNYANYEGDDAEVEKYMTNGTKPVYNIETGDKYSYIEALRRVAKAHTELNKEKSVQITITGEDRTLEPNAKNTAYVLIMCNPLKKEQVKEGLKLSIYTDEGMVSNIDLTKVHAESEDYTVVTNKAIEEVSPSVSNTVEIEIDNNSFVVPQTMEIFNSNDLEQFIKWGTSVAGERNNIAILQQDVTFTPEMLAALKANKNTSISIVSPDKVDVENRAILTLDKNLPANVLDEKQLSFSATGYKATPIVVEGEVALTKKSAKVASIEVAKGATLTINDKDAVVPDMQPGVSTDYYSIVNNGSLNIGADAVVAENVHVQNNATMTVAADGDCKASVVNTKDAVIENNGYMLNVTNQANATIKLGANAILRQSTNEGLIKTATGAQVSVTGSAAGEIEYVSGVKTIVADNNTVSTRVAGTTITKTTFDATKIGCTISKLIVGEGITTLADATDTAYEYSFKEVVLENNAELVVGSTHKLSVTNMTVEGDATVNGNITATNVTVEEEGTLVNNGKLATATFENNGAVENNGTVTTTSGSVTGKGSWKYNPVQKTEDPNAKTAKEEAMLKAVKIWADSWDDFYAGKTYYAGDPYDYAKFYAAAQVSGNTWGNIIPTLTAAGFKLEDLAKEPTEFADMVTEMLDEKKATAEAVLYKEKKWSLEVAGENPVVAHEGEKEAMETMFTAVAGMADRFNNDRFNNDYVAAAYVWSKNAQATAWSRFQEANPTAYVWTGCTLDKAIELWAEYSDVITSIKENRYAADEDATGTGTNYAESLGDWIIAVMNLEKAGFAGSAQDDITDLKLNEVSAINNLKKYTNAQVNALDETLTVSD